MIGKLKGRIDMVNEDSVIIDVGGVGYEVFCSSRTLAMLEKGAAAELTIETHVREDHIHLYGFPDAAERDWFRLLCTVQGVGSKTGLSILGAFSPQKIVHAILAKDASAFRAVSGIGPKLAERIVTELKDKVTKLPIGECGVSSVECGKKKNLHSTLHIPHSAHHSVTEDAISALVNLGYSRSEAYGAAVKAGSGNLDEVIRLSLKELVRR